MMSITDKIKPYYFLTVLLMPLLIGCSEYIDINVPADYSYFSTAQNVHYRNIQTGEIKNLMVKDTQCVETGTSTIQAAIHLYHVLHFHRCGQIKRQSDEIIGTLDHSITSQSVAFNPYNNVFVYFDHVNFVLEPLPAVSDAHFVQLEIKGITYPNVYALGPDKKFNGYSIDSIYFLPELGIVQLKTVDQQVWKIE